MKKNKFLIAVQLFLIISSFAFSQASIANSKEVMVEGYKYPYRWNNSLAGDEVHFSEIWGYVLAERASEINSKSELTDIGLFAAEIDSFGKVVNIPSRKIIKNFSGRVHLVAICESRALSHFIVALPNYRKNVADTLLEAARDFDGIQIDFELVPKEDAENYLAFLKYLKSKLKKSGKQLTVCVHARTKTLSQDAEDYKAIGNVADRIMIMAYDEHWTTSDPGSIASMAWCKRIAEYALTIWPPEKYIMGLPFYGRTWPEKNWRSAWYFEGINRIQHENDVKLVKRDDDIPHFSFKTEITVNGWYEDAHSITMRSRMYKDYGFDSIAFWRIGQEDDAVWDWIKSKE